MLRTRSVKSPIIIAVTVLASALAGAVGVLRGGPMLSLMRFSDALDRDDTSAISASVDFDAVRADVRTQVLASLDLAGRKDLVEVNMVRYARLLRAAQDHAAE